MRNSLICLLLLCSCLGSADIAAIYGTYGPVGRVSGGRQTVTWKVKGTGGGRVTRVELLLNELPVPAVYNESNCCVEYSPAQPFGPGLYVVTCRATIEGELIVRQDWSFEVSGDGSASLGTFGADVALDVLNQYRRALALPGLRVDTRLSAAAVAHSHYQTLNSETCHVEDPAKPGFTGKMPWDRTAAFGATGPCYEGTCGNQADPRKAVRLLFDAPYHRIPFLQPGSPTVGIGMESSSLTIEYAVSEVESVGESPAPGQNDIPLGWDGNESPSPLRLHGANGMVGYPIVFAWMSPTLEPIKVEVMRLTDSSGNAVPSYLNTPGNDPELKFAAILTPQTRLQPATRYTVVVKAYSSRGKDLSRTWSFTTAKS